VISTTQSDFIGGNVKNAQSFRISANSHMFDILRKKIYNRPAESCVRELVDNSRDAMVEAGKAHLPVEIFVGPNSFSVKDRGIGLTPEQITEIYTVYGESSKRDTNSQTGQLGIGSKTPWAISSIFTVESITNKIKRTYQAYINDTNTGAITLTSEEETDEENGVTIQVPFRLKVEHLAPAVAWRHLSGIPTPIVYGCEIPKAEIYLDRGKWLLNKGPQSGILYNGLFYPKDLKVPGEHYSSCKRLILRFNIGELEIAANREEIPDTDSNKQLIGARVKEAYDEIKKEELFNQLDFNEALSAWNDSLRWISEFRYKGEIIPTGSSYPGYSRKECHRRGFGANSYRVSAGTENLLSTSHFIYEDVPHKRTSVRQYMIDNHITRCLLVPVGNPLEKYCDIKASELPKGNIPYTPRGPKVRKIKVKKNGKGSWLKLADDPTKTFYYLVGDVSCWGLSHLDVYCVDYEDREYVEGLPNWHEAREADRLLKLGRIATIGLTQDDALSIMSLSKENHYGRIRRYLVKRLLNVELPANFSWTEVPPDKNAPLTKLNQWRNKYPLIQYLEDETPIYAVADYMDSREDYNG
jgi:hypothetical protein